MPPLMIRLFATALLLVHGWLFWMIGCGVLDRRFPFAYWRSVVGLLLSTVLVGALVLARPVMTGQFTLAALLPLGALGLLFATLWAGRKATSPDLESQSSPLARRSDRIRWLAVIASALVNGLLLTLGLHVLFAIGESFLPRNVMDPPFLRLAGFAAPLLPERILLALLVPSALVLSGSACAPNRRRTVSIVLSLLVLGVVLGGGVLAGWTFGRVYVASVLEPAITVVGLLLAIAFVWRREGRRDVSPREQGSAAFSARTS